MARERTTLGQRVIQFIRKHSLILPGETALVAVSGGADSVCLLHILAQRQTELGIKLHVAHLNHKLRGDEAEEDAWYVADLAHELGIPITMDTRDVAAYRDRKRCSIEEAAREVRYNFLADAARSAGAASVAVGHTRDDQVETILMHLLRGTGIVGLRGLQPKASLLIGNNNTSVMVVRPLLETSRQEAADYCRRFKVKPRSDSSNESPEFLRNRVRLELLPALRHYNPKVDTALLRMAGIASDQADYIEEQASDSWNEVATVESSVVYLDKNRMLNLPPAIQCQLFRRAVEQLIGNLRDIEADHIEAMVGFLSKQAGKSLCLPHDLRLFVEYGRLVLATNQTALCPFTSIDGEISIKVPGETILQGWKIKTAIFHGKPGIAGNERDAFTAIFDLAKAGTQLTVRHRQRGDRFQPIGMSQAKKLQDFMVDARIPRSWRSRVPLLCSPQQILWVAGWRMDDRVRVTEATEKFLKVKFQRASHDCGF